MEVLALVEEAGREAKAAAASLARASDEVITKALEGIITRLGSQAEPILDANREDVSAAQGRLSGGLLDRLRLDEARLEGIATEVRSLAAQPPIERVAGRWQAPAGASVEERRIPIGVVGANYEARANVTVDIATQFLKSGNAGVLRTGSAALRTAEALLEHAVAPSLEDAGLDPHAIRLVGSGDRSGAEALCRLPNLIPLVILRGSGPTTAHLQQVAARHGTRTLAHAEGGGVLYVHPSTDPAFALQMIERSLDRLGVCNRLNLLLVDEAIYESFVPAAVAKLESLGVSASLPPHDHPLGYEWAMDDEREATVTVAPAADPVAAAETANAETSGLAAGICAAGEDAARAFLEAYRGTGGFWNATTRLLDGFKLTGAPETGINVDRVPGPRGPVTYRDLFLRQYVITDPDATR